MLIELVTVLGLVLTNVICYACHDKSLFRGKVKGPKLLFVSNRSAQLANKTPKGYWALDVLDPAHLVSSHVLNDVCVLLLKVLSLVFFTVTLILEGLTGDGFGNVGSWFTFFTNWTFLLFGIWSVAGVILSGWYIQAKLNTTAIKGRDAVAGGAGSEEGESLTGVAQSSSTSDRTAPWALKMKWGPLSAVYLFMTQTVATATLFLSFFYWTFLFSPRFPIEVDSLLKHGVNNGLLLLEVLLCRAPFVSYHYQVCLLYGTVYTLFMWLYHAASLHWVYYVLDWSQPTALLLYILNPLFMFAAFSFWYSIACIREWLGSKLQPAQPMTSLQQVDFQ